MENDKKKRRKKKAESGSDGIHADGDVIIPKLSAEGAELDGSTFGPLNVDDPVPGAWLDRAKKAWECYKHEPIVNNVINAWRVFALGDEIRFGCDDKTVRREVEDAARRLKINPFIQDCILNLLVTGDAACRKCYSDDGTDIDELLGIDPTTVNVKCEHGKLLEMIQYADAGAFTDPVVLPSDQVLHVKWNAPQYAARGNSMVTAAFHSIEILRDYRKVQEAIAKRWATPLRFIKVGGRFGDKLLIPDQKMLEDVRKVMEGLDLRSGVVMPPWVEVETHGAEGQLPDFEKKIQEAKEEAIIALGLSRSIVTGEGAKFSTASISLQKMVVMLKEIRQAARDILNWVFDGWKELKGYEDRTITYIFSDLELNNRVDIVKLYLELYDRGVMSGSTLLARMGLDPNVENARREIESRIPVEPTDAESVLALVLSGIMSVETARERLGLIKKSESQPG